MGNKLDEKEIIEFLDRFEQNNLDKRKVYDFILKLVNSYYILDKTLNEELDILKKRVSSKHLEVSTLLINSIEKQEFLNYISFGLKELKEKDGGKNYTLIARLENQVLNYSMFAENSWDYLFQHFLVHQKVDLKKTLKKFNLTESEYKVCALIYMDFSSKAIAKILNISKRSIDAQKYRIKKKFGLEKNEKILDFLNLEIEKNKVE